MPDLTPSAAALSPSSLRAARGTAFLIGAALLALQGLHLSALVLALPAAVLLAPPLRRSRAEEAAAGGGAFLERTGGNRRIVTRPAREEVPGRRLRGEH